MRISERTEIEWPASRVWNYVSNPDCFRKWNKNIVSMEARDHFSVGQPFMTHYKLGKKQGQCISVVTAMIEGKLLELHHSNCTSANGPNEMGAVERITLEEHNGRTVVTKDVFIKNHGVPLILLPLIWFVSRFGRPKEPDRLKAMCESDA